MIAPYNVPGQIYLFYQHYSGDLRYSELTDNGWQGGGSAEIAGFSSVKNGTHVAGCSGELDDVIYSYLLSYLFYVDTSGTVQEVYQRNNSTGSWSAGNFGSLNFRASDSHHAAFTSCWDKHWYGSNPGNSSGMRFYAGGDDGLIHEFTWDSASNVRGIGYTFPNSNGNAGAKCWPGSSDPVSYLYMQNAKYELELWWKDYNTTQTNSSTHPLGVWNQGPVAAGINIQPNSSLAMSFYAYFQDSNNQIIGILPNTSSENSSWGASFIVGDETTLPGTSIECQTFSPSTDSPSVIYVFFQTNGTDLMEYVRPQFWGAWSTNSVPVG
ncbi:hypothetical protein MMC08_006132 [Hypocenomyce scalaris]|nr:hypothetical protein [Hypocenomyce scalaris]